MDFAPSQNFPPRVLEMGLCHRRARSTSCYCCHDPPKTPVLAALSPCAGLCSPRHCSERHQQSPPWHPRATSTSSLLAGCPAEPLCAVASTPWGGSPYRSLLPPAPWTTPYSLLPRPPTSLCFLMRRQPRIRALEKTSNCRGAHGGSLVMSPKSSHLSGFVSHSLKLGFGFLLLHWPSSSTRPFHTVTTSELSLSSKKSSVPPKFGESALGASREQLPKLTAEPLPLCSVLRHCGAGRSIRPSRACAPAQHLPGSRRDIFSKHDLPTSFCVLVTARAPGRSCGSSTGPDATCVPVPGGAMPGSGMHSWLSGCFFLTN